MAAGIVVHLRPALFPNNLPGTHEFADNLSLAQRCSIQAWWRSLGMPSWVAQQRKRPPSQRHAGYDAMVKLLHRVVASTPDTCRGLQLLLEDLTFPMDGPVTVPTCLNIPGRAASTVTVRYTACGWPFDILLYYADCIAVFMWNGEARCRIMQTLCAAAQRQDPEALRYDITLIRPFTSTASTPPSPLPAAKALSKTFLFKQWPAGKSKCLRLT